jgi:hypothetical protein
LEFSLSYQNILYLEMEGTVDTRLVLVGTILP